MGVDIVVKPAQKRRELATLHLLIHIRNRDIGPFFIDGLLVEHYLDEGGDMADLRRVW